MKIKTILKKLGLFDNGWRVCPTCRGFCTVPDKNGHEHICKSCSGIGEVYVPTHIEMG